MFRNTAFRKLKKKVNKAFRPWAVSLYIISFYIHYFLLLAWAENAPTDPFEPSDYMYYNIFIRDWLYIKKSAYLLHLTALVLIPSTLSPSLFLWTLSRETVTEDTLLAMQIVFLKGNLLNIYYWALYPIISVLIPSTLSTSLFLWTLSRETVTEDMLSAMQIVFLKGNLLNIYHWAVSRTVPYYLLLGCT